MGITIKYFFLKSGELSREIVKHNQTCVPMVGDVIVSTIHYKVTKRIFYPDSEHVELYCELYKYE